MFYLIDEIEKLFTTYGYKVRVFFNQNKKDILDIVDHYSQKEHLRSLICFISSYGDQTSLACPDGDNVHIFDILKMVIPMYPKVFFFDVCSKYCYNSNRDSI